MPAILAKNLHGFPYSFQADTDIYIKSGQDFCIPQPFKYTIHQTLITKHHAVCISKTVIK